jgi:hypothetical protein
VGACPCARSPRRNRPGSMGGGMAAPRSLLLSPWRSMNGPLRFPQLSKRPLPARGNLRRCADRIPEEMVKCRPRQSRSIGPPLCDTAPLWPGGLPELASHPRHAPALKDRISRAGRPVGRRQPQIIALLAPWFRRHIAPNDTAGDYRRRSAERLPSVVWPQAFNSSCPSHICAR